MSYEISPLDGRYAGRLGHLGRFFSEFALMRYRCKVELLYLNALQGGPFPELTPEETARVDDALAEFSDEDYRGNKKVEKTTNHDVKACELFLAEKLGLRHPEMIHFGLTSEDVNNLAYSLLLKDFVAEEQVGAVELLARQLLALALDWKGIPFPASTHGQPASPTTAGKEVAVFLSRLVRQLSKLKKFRFAGKLNGATGNFSALRAAVPECDWIRFSIDFVASLGLEANPVTTQIEDHDRWCEYFDLVRRINSIVLDLDTDAWEYISRGYLVQRPAAGEVGSSTMPHKVNPINFENSEGNLALSNSLLHTLSDRLSGSRMQRDLSDSTVERNMGVALAHSMLALGETVAGLKKVKLDEDACLTAIRTNPGLLAEPFQTILRTAGMPDAYDRLKELTRGRQVTVADFHALADSLDLPGHLRERLRSQDACSYLGEAERLTELGIAAALTELDPTEEV